MSHTPLTSVFTGKDYFSNDAGTHMSTCIEALRLIEIITDDLTGNSGIFSTTLQSKPTGSATDTHGPATTTGDTTSPRSGTDLCQFMQTSPSGNPGNLHNVYRSDSVVTRKVTGYPASHQSTSEPLTGSLHCQYLCNLQTGMSWLTHGMTLKAIPWITNTRPHLGGQLPPPQ